MPLWLWPVDKVAEGQEEWESESVEPPLADLKVLLWLGRCFQTDFSVDGPCSDWAGQNKYKPPGRVLKSYHRALLSSFPLFWVSVFMTQLTPPPLSNSYQYNVVQGQVQPSNALINNGELRHDAS